MAMIGHELRTPLAGVLSMVELLEDRLAGPLSPRQAVYVHSIRDSGERLLEVINSVTLHPSPQRPRPVRAVWPATSTLCWPPQPPASAQDRHPAAGSGD